MDTTTITTIIITIIAIVPGIWALINQANKDKMTKEERLEKAYDIGYTAMGFIEGMQGRVSKLQIQTSDMIDRLSDMDKEKYIDGLWERLYQKPVIIRCEHCSSPNVVTNITCTQCGAPLKQY